MEPQLLQEIIESAETPTPIEIAGNNKSINDLSTEQIVFPLASEEKKRVYERTIATFSPGSSLEELSPSARKSEEKKIGKNSSELNVYKRVIKNNIYSLGLDRSLFERISAAYMRRLSELQPMGEYLKMTPKGPPKDVKELIQRGRPVNL